MTAVVIVESPAKAKTIEKFLGSGYQVVATYGHIRDLPSKDGSVDTEQGFQMRYEVTSKASRHVEALAKAARSAELLLLATDPDREGEAISWHVREILQEKLKGKIPPVKRVVFHEITKRAIQEAVASARDVDMNLVDAQQARRALDYLVGFNLSPLLWKKVRYGLSAGRVQSVALRLICEREEEIRKFRPQEYWSIQVETGKVGKGNQQAKFAARLVRAEGKKVGKLDIPNEEVARRHEAAIREQPLFVAALEKKQVARNPAPPFITSTLQQEASRKLGFSAKKTMMVAQQLYEGMDVPAVEGGMEVVGLITYMRTDSVNLAQEAVTALRGLIEQRFGKAFVPKTPRGYKSSAKNAQEAHEAIRPTDPERTPERLKEALSRDAWRLYELIWKRTVAAQMESARIDQVAASLSVGGCDVDAPYLLRATGSSIAFSGFLEAYSEGRDEVSLQDRNEDESETMLPPLTEGEGLTNKGVKSAQHFTEPKPRYTEATLVKSLESYGIGRPSTYAPIMSTLQDRGYVRLDKRQFFPEDVGMVVNHFLVEHFPKYLDYHFTAHLEDDLDAVSRGERQWIPLMTEFWQPFIDQVQEKERSTKKSDVTSEATDELCPECQSALVIKLGRYGRFKACTGYPQCRYAQPLSKEGEEEKPVVEPVYADRECDQCGQPMLIKEGRYGKYLSCSAYPTCKNRQPLVPPKETGVECPDCKKGRMLEKKSRFGKIFYSCSDYPKCKKALWDRPLPEPCPNCHAPFLTEKVTKRRGTERICVAVGCGYRVTVAGEPDEDG